MAFAWPGGETELCSQANLAGNVIPFDPTGWQGLGNVSLQLVSTVSEGVSFARRYALQCAHWEQRDGGCFPAAKPRVELSFGAGRGCRAWLSWDTRPPCLQRAPTEQGCPTATFSNPLRTLLPHLTGSSNIVDVDGGSLVITREQG